MPAKKPVSELEEREGLDKDLADVTDVMGEQNCAREHELGFCRHGFLKATIIHDKNAVFRAFCPKGAEENTWCYAHRAQALLSFARVLPAHNNIRSKRP